MKLKTWLRLNQIQIHMFAKMIGKNRSLVHKYIYEDVIPKHDIMVKIYRITFGLVSANDFHELSDRIFDDENFQQPDFQAEEFHDESFK